jgi:hypothetical protein
MSDKKNPIAWVVVEVAAGIPVSVEGFKSQKAAQKHEQKLRKEMHPENDETGVFPLAVSASKDSTGGR